MFTEWQDEAEQRVPFATAGPRAAVGLDSDYEAAMNSVRGAIDHFRSCSPDERAALRRDLDQLHAMAEKLAAGKVEIVVFGEISTGKSALINALVGEAVAEVSVRGGWTKDVWNLNWKGAGYCVPGLADSQVVLIDTPGLNEVDGTQRGTMAHDAAARADLVLFVVDSDLNEVEYSALTELAASHKPIILVLNKADLYPPKDLAELMSVFQGSRLAGLVDRQNVVPTKADPRQVEYYVESASGQARRSGANRRQMWRYFASGYWKSSRWRERRSSRSTQPCTRLTRAIEWARCACECAMKRRRPRFGASPS